MAGTGSGHLVAGCPVPVAHPIAPTSKQSGIIWRSLGQPVDNPLGFGEPAARLGQLIASRSRALGQGNHRAEHR